LTEDQSEFHIYTEDFESNKRLVEIGGTDLKSRAIGSKKMVQKTVPDEAISKTDSFKKPLQPNDQADITPAPFFPSNQQKEADLRREIEQLEKELEQLMQERKKATEQIRTLNNQNIQGWDDGFKATKIKFKQSVEEKQKEAHLLENEIEKLSKESELLEMESIYAESQLDQLSDVFASLRQEVILG
jgi:flagellar biosynthesis/type III secretory pathway protein FliH